VSDPRARPRTPVPRRPAERYGRPPNPARVRTTYAVGAIVALVAVGALLALALHKSRPAVAAGVTGFTVVSDSAVQVRFEVHKAPLAEAVCTVRARDRSGLEAGREEVTVGPRRDSRRVTSVTHDLATRSRAVSGELVGCHITRDH